MRERERERAVKRKTHKANSRDLEGRKRERKEGDAGREGRV